MIISTIPASLSPGELATVQNEQVGLEQYVGLADGSAFPSKGYKEITACLVQANISLPWDTNNTDLKVLKNTVGDFVFSVFGTGIWRIVTDGLFPESKFYIDSEVYSATDDDLNESNRVVSLLNENTVQIAALFEGIAIDGPPLQKCFTLRVYH